MGKRVEIRIEDSKLAVTVDNLISGLTPQQLIALFSRSEEEIAENKLVKALSEGQKPGTQKYDFSQFDFVAAISLVFENAAKFQIPADRALRLILMATRTATIKEE